MQKAWRVLRLIMSAVGLNERRCFSCGESFISETELGKGYPAKEDLNVSGMICSHCLQLLAVNLNGYCRFCALPFPDGHIGNGICQSCASSLPPWKEIFFLGSYENLLRDLVLKLKFGNSLCFANLLGKMLADRIILQLRERGELAAEAYSAVVPVPVHPSRLLQRGYNQSLELCRFISRNIKVPLRSNWLYRKISTPPQEQLSRSERLSAVRGVFDVKGRLLNEKILLVDDVMTTGATISECAALLSWAGAASVGVAVLARTPL